jgi:hypothetical protein
MKEFSPGKNKGFRAELPEIYRAFIKKESPQGL